MKRNAVVIQKNLNNRFDLFNNLRDYLDVSLFDKTKETISHQSHDLIFSNNEIFWESIIENDILPGQIVYLKGFKLLEWIPMSPGLFHTWQGKESRKSAFKNAKKYIDDYNHIVLRPSEKADMVSGGYGSLRIAPKNIQNNLQYILCASDTGVSHEGIAITLKQEHYSKIVDEISRGRIPVVNIVGRLSILPSELSPIKMKYSERVPKVYLDVLELDILEFKPSTDALISVAIIYSSQIINFRNPYFVSYSFCSFNPTKGNSDLFESIEWLKNYAKKYSETDDPIIIGDFDEIYEHFNSTVFPIKDIANGNIPIDKLYLFKDFFNFEINNTQIMGDKIMGDKNEFHNSQIGAVGSNAQSNNNTFNQQVNALPVNFDYVKLSEELATLKQSLILKAKSADEFKAISEIAGAEDASKNSDGQSIMKHLKAAGTWVFDTAKDIGVDIVTELLKKQMGV